MAAAKFKRAGIDDELLEQLQGLLVQYPSLMGEIRGFNEWSHDLVMAVDRTLLQSVFESELTRHKMNLEYNKRVVVRVFRDYILKPREECRGFTLPRIAVRFRENPPRNLSQLTPKQLDKLLYHCRDVAYAMKTACATRVPRPTGGSL
jgi:hypothetical protein